MKKSKGQRRNTSQKRPTQSPVQKEIPQRRRWWAAPLTGILAAATLIGGVAAVATFEPRVVVTSNGPVDPSSPWPMLFNIQNNGFSEVYNLDVYFGGGGIAFDRERNFGFGNASLAEYCGLIPASGGRIQARGWANHRLQVDEIYKINVGDVIGFGPAAGKAVAPMFLIDQPAHLEGGDISIFVEFRLWFWPCTLSKEFRFATRREGDKLDWYQIPVDKGVRGYTSG